MDNKDGKNLSELSEKEKKQKKKELIFLNGFVIITILLFIRAAIYDYINGNLVDFSDWFGTTIRFSLLIMLLLMIQEKMEKYMNVIYFTTGILMFFLLLY